MRAVQPAWEGTVERAGATLRFEVYGQPGVTIVLLPTWEVVHSRIWKMQIGYLSRHFRVVVYDAAGTGRSSRPAVSARYTHTNRVDDALAVLDATETTAAVVVGSSMGGEVALCLAAYHPDRVLGVVAVAPRHPWSTEPDRGPAPAPYDPVSNPVPDGWAKFDPEYWRHGYADFVNFFMTEVNSDPHSSKGIEDAVGWALEQTPEVLSSTLGELNDFDPDDLKRRWQTLTVPTLLVHGTEDRMTTVDSTIRLRDWIPEADLLTLEGAGHSIVGRYPIRFNQAVHDFATAVSPKEAGSGRPTAVRAASWATFGASRKRLLYLSSPVGLGHARRDVAISGELRALHPDVEIDWLAQDPVTRVLDAAGLRIHPASAWLASESAHIEAECGEHALDAFQSMRTMDEIMCHNFHIFDEVLESGQYDLVIADEAFDVDHYLFENAHLKKAPLAWMTDFVGFLPMAAAGPRQAVLTADYNLEMLEHVARHPRLRDAAVFVGSPEDIVDGTFGDGLPAIRDWAVDHFDFSGYITGFDPRALGDRQQLRAGLGYAEDDVVCVVSVGGSGVGTDLLRRVVAAYPVARDAIPPLRMIVVTGPRIDPRGLPQIPGVEYHGYVDRLFRWLTAADLAIVQGGLTTTMELTAARVPFIYVPLREHFEQNHHVRARLARYHAGLCLEYDQLDPDTLAEAMLKQLTGEVHYEQVETDGAAHAARLIDQLL